MKSEQINAKGSRSDSSSVSSFSSYRKLLLTLSRLLYILYCKCFRFGIICAFVSNTNAQDGVDMLPTALRHTAEDTATYFNHTRKVCCSIVFKFFFCPSPISAADQVVHHSLSVSRISQFTSAILLSFITGFKVANKITTLLMMTFTFNMGQIQKPVLFSFWEWFVIRDCCNISG